MWFTFQCFFGLTNRATHAKWCILLHRVRPCSRKAVEEREKQPNTVLTFRKRKGFSESFLGTFELGRRITSAVFDAIFPAHSASIACGLTLSRRILKKPIKLPTTWRNRTLSHGPHLLQEKLAMGTQCGGRRTAGNCQHTEPELEQKSVRSFLIHWLFRHLNSTTSYPLHRIRNTIFNGGCRVSASCIAVSNGFSCCCARAA